MRYTYNEKLAIYVGKRVKAKRAIAKISQNKLAEECLLSCGTVSRWESGDHSPSLESLLRAALIMGVEPAELLPKLKDLGRILR